ncbi:MAG: transcriptional repressor NrdR [Veillonella sp.]|nr:transcriptional repressor NrdR [Veillonella sp.]MCF0155486.1 transcriptional repressor NrdR [Veillonella sp.]
MRCPYCQNTDTKVTDSRTTDEGNSIRRRRECNSCGRRFTTYEVVEEVPLMVLKRSGRRELFDRGKLLNGLLRSCDKRTVPMETMEEVVNEVERQIRNEINQEVTTDRIGELVLEQLRDIDQVSYVRFASVYRKFDNIDSFMEELNKLKKMSEKNASKEKA